MSVMSDARKKRRRTPEPSANGDGRNPAPAIDTFTAADLVRMDLPEPEWAVEGLLPEGLSIFAGRPKLGKSWLMLNTAIAVAAGGVALGSIAVAQGDVLYLALEDNRRRLKKRVIKLLERQQAKAPRCLSMQTAWPRVGDGGLEAIDGWLTRHPQARLVCIDTWAKFRRRRLVRGNEYEMDYHDGSEVQELALAHGVSVTALHHSRKMGADDPLDEVSGTLGLTGAADAVLVLRRARGQCDATLCVTGRDVDERDLALRWDSAYALWSALGDAQQYRVTQEQKDVLDAIRKRGPMNPTELAAALVKPYQATKKLAWRMAQADRLVSVNGKYALPAAPGVPGVPGVDGDSARATGDSASVPDDEDEQGTQTPFD
jgi:hypothetical protein